MHTNRSIQRSESIPLFSLILNNRYVSIYFLHHRPHFLNGPIWPNDRDIYFFQIVPTQNAIEMDER